MQRREFLKQTSAAAVVSCFPASLAGIERSRAGQQLERRSLGRTGERLSIIGFGGIVVMDATTKEAAERVAHAIDRGVNYFDVAPSYGNAEEMLGPALEPYRKQVFLACKTQKRDRGGRDRGARTLARAHAHRPLRPVSAACGHDEGGRRSDTRPGGALEAFVAARQAGKVRFLGFSAHSVDGGARACMNRFAFDTILFPINFATWHAGNFGPQVLEAAQRKQMGILALKSMARRPWPEGAAKTHPKCWYEPLATETTAARGPAVHALSSGNRGDPARRREPVRMALDLAASLRAAQRRPRPRRSSARGSRRPRSSKPSGVVATAASQTLIVETDHAPGVLSEVARVIAEHPANIASIETLGPMAERATLYLEIEHVDDFPACWRAWSSSPSCARCTSPSR